MPPDVLVEARQREAPHVAGRQVDQRDPVGLRECSGCAVLPQRCVAEREADVALRVLRLHELDLDRAQPAVRAEGEQLSRLVAPVLEQRQHALRRVGGQHWVRAPKVMRRGSAVDVVQGSRASSARAGAMEMVPSTRFGAGSEAPAAEEVETAAGPVGALTASRSRSGVATSAVPPTASVTASADPADAAVRTRRRRRRPASQARRARSGVRTSSASSSSSGPSC
jgi:hypothetical protein